MQVSITFAEASSLTRRALEGAGFSASEAAVIGDQIIECEKRGVSYAGLSRALSLCERAAEGPPPRPPVVTRETAVSAAIEGGGTCGYLVASQAVELVIRKATASGIAIVGANDTWMTGMFAYYLEKITRAGLVGLVVGSSSPRVAPFGATEARFGTNPIGIAVPSTGDPVIFDIGTSELSLAELNLAARLGQRIPAGKAFDKNGAPTTDPAQALVGALKAWAGHRGSGFALMVQLLGMMVGGHALPPMRQHHALLVIAVRPDLFGDPERFRGDVQAYVDAIHSAEPEDPAHPVRVPFERSATARRRILAAGVFVTSVELVEDLERWADRA